MSAISGSRVLVTGGSGLIGSHTVDRLISEDVDSVVVFDKVINEQNLADARASRKVKIIQGDIHNSADLEPAIRGVDYVVHCAAMLRLASAEDPKRCLEDNIVSMFGLLELLDKHKVQRLVYASTTAVYGSSGKKAAMTEDHPFNNKSMYGASKIIGEQFCRVFNEMTGLEYLALRYSCVYGPRQHHYGLYPRLIMKSLDRMARGQAPQIEGKGEEVQDFIYVQDAAEANILACKSNVSDEAINIASGTSITVKELVQTVIDITNPKLEIEFLPSSQTALVPFRWFSTEKAERLLGFTAGTDLRAGLKRLIEWKNGRSTV